MDELESMKGTPRIVLTILQEGRIYQLREYPDGSLGISRDGLILGIWEPDQESECIAELARLTKIAQHSEPVLIVRQVNETASTKETGLCWN